MRFIKGAVALLAVGAVAFGGSIAGTSYVLDSREQAELEAQEEAQLARERSAIEPGVDDSVEAAANAPEIRDNIGSFTVRCQVHEGDEDGPLMGFVLATIIKASIQHCIARRYSSPASRRKAMGKSAIAGHGRTTRQWVRSMKMDGQSKTLG